MQASLGPYTPNIFYRYQKELKYKQKYVKIYFGSTAIIHHKSVIFLFFTEFDRGVRYKRMHDPDSADSVIAETGNFQ